MIAILVRSVRRRPSRSQRYGNVNGVAGQKANGVDNTVRLCASYFFQRIAWHEKTDAVN